MLFSCNEKYMKEKKLITIRKFIPSMKAASLSIEAALVFPVFVFALMMLINIIIFIGLQVRIQLALYNTALTIAKYEYVYEVVKYEKDIDLNELEEGSLVSKIIGQGLEVGTVKALVVSELGYDYLEDSYIKGGASGLKFYRSEILNSEGIIDIVVEYSLESPFDIFGWGTIPVTQRARVHAFCGDESLEKEEIIYVYVAPTGTVYHTDDNCTYLKVKIKSVEYSEVGEERNSGGAKYYPCERCYKMFGNLYKVYITDYGTRYHSDKNCSQIKHGIMKIPLEEVGDKRCCSKCEGED